MVGLHRRRLAAQRPLRPPAASAHADRTAGHLIIILSFGDPGRAVRCARSIREPTGELAHHLLVVRNGCEVPGAGLAQTIDALGDADLLVLNSNRGFSGGMNAGLQWGIDHGFTVMTVLNDDTVATSAAFDRLAAAADADPTGAFCPRIDYLPPRSQPWFVGGVGDPVDGLPRHLTVPEFERLPLGPAGVTVPFVTGCCVTASTQLWLATGGFDERYFLYFEDSDWSMRARRIGLRLTVEPATCIQHEVSASSTGAAAHLTSFYYSRNLLLFGTSWPSAGMRPWRTWWSRSARPAVRTLRRDPAAGMGELSMTTLGAVAFLTRSTGPAPAIVGRIAARLPARSAGP